MPGHNIFYDTNVLLYLLSDDQRKSSQAETTLAQGGVISVQVLNEFTAVARRKQKLSYAEIREVLDVARAIFQVVSLKLSTHDMALNITQRHGYMIYDALIIAAALQAGCAWLYSEDMQHGQLIEDQLRIHNPFVSPNAPAI